MSVRFFKSSSIKSGEKTSKFWDQSAVEFNSDYELITTTVLTTDTASVTFGSLGDYSSTYKHLQIRLVARSSRSGETDSRMRLQFNNITSSNYFQHNLTGTGSAVTSGATTGVSSIEIGRITANDSAANNFGAAIIDVFDPYSTSKNKTFRSLTGSTNLNRIMLLSGSLAETGSVTEIKLLEEFANFKTGSRFSLYGIKG
jgi:hypothetical protein